MKETMQHPNCNVDPCPTCAKSASRKNANAGQKRFCEACGTDRTRFCETCGTEIRKSAWNRIGDLFMFVTVVVGAVILIEWVL